MGVDDRGCQSATAHEHTGHRLAFLNANLGRRCLWLLLGRLLLVLLHRPDLSDIVLFATDCTRKHQHTLSIFDTGEIYVGGGEGSEESRVSKAE